MSALRTGVVRSVLRTGTARPDGMVPVQAAVTMAPATGLTRVLYVPEADVPRFAPHVRFVWLPVDGEVQVAAVGRDADQMLGLVAS